MGARLRLGLSAVAVAAAASTVGNARRAAAGPHDLALTNLCQPKAGPGGTSECSWIERDAEGRITAVTAGREAESQFRSLMSELGVALAPRALVPADTLGFAGFQVSAELGLTRVSRDAPFWNGVEAVAPQSPAASRPDRWLTTIGAFVRKGVWLGVPAFEVGAGAMNLIDSRMVSWQGYAKLALHEGFHRWPLPSLALRGAASYVTGADQARLAVLGADVIVSKSFGVRGTWRFEPYAGGSSLFIRARSGTLDLTPGCDAHVVSRSTPGGPALPAACGGAQPGTRNDFLANYRFSDQDLITRQRWFAGAKLKLGALFLTGEYQLIPAGNSRDGNKPNGARDRSAEQRSVSLAAGFDY